jgi:hypothetical protein
MCNRWWRQCAPLKLRPVSTWLHGAISQKTLNLIIAAVRTWYLTGLRTSWMFIMMVMMTLHSLLRQESYGVQNWWWRQHVHLKRRSTIILHGSTSQKTILNFILAAVRTWNLTSYGLMGYLLRKPWYRRSTLLCFYLNAFRLESGDWGPHSPLAVNMCPPNRRAPVKRSVTAVKTLVSPPVSLLPRRPFQKDVRVRWKVKRKGRWTWKNSSYERSWSYCILRRALEERWPTEHECGTLLHSIGNSVGRLCSNNSNKRLF